PVNDFLSQLPQYVTQFFSDYKQPLLTVGIFIVGIITVKVTLALLDAINDIPLLAPILELVGLGYTGWFVYRYLLKAADRQELIAEFNKLKMQVLGSDS
ncbi:MAG: CAAD domain-containing protein, partial [Cyanobacteriota bacterium]|nr:CAAD domain-containing protein [Cyanobacteriota bacterium]